MQVARPRKFLQLADHFVHALRKAEYIKSADKGVAKKKPQLAQEKQSINPQK